MRIDEGLLIAFRDGTLAAEKQEYVEQLLAKSAEARLLLRELSAPVNSADIDAVMAKLAPDDVVPLRPKKKLWVPVVAALAAGVLAVVMVGNSEKPLGRYQLELEGGEAQTRGSTPSAHTVVGAESRLVVRLRAEAATDDARAVGVFLEDANGRLTRVNDAKVISSRGSFEVTFTGNAWLGSTGSHVVWLHVAGDEAAMQAWVGRSAAGGEGWWRVDVERRQ